jgi:hypothetical protein
MSTADDKLAILEVMTSYFFALDALADPAALMGHYAPDAVWECYNYGEKEPALRFDSREQIEMVVAMESAKPSPQLLRHHPSGTLFRELTATTAVTRTKVLVTAQQPEDPAPRVRNTATCEGRWSKHEQGWKLSRWTIFRDPAA